MLKEVQIQKFKQLLQKENYTIEENIPLKQYTSLEIGGPARLLSKPTSMDEVYCVVHAAVQANIPYFIIGNGSNILADDDGFDGLIIVTKEKLKSIFLVDETTIVAQAGISLMDVCLFALEHHLTGLEFAYGIPASVGGAVYMNAGAYGGEIKDVLQSCTYLDEHGDVKTIHNEELNFSYRHSYFSDSKAVVMEASFHLEKGNYDEIKQKMDELLQRRKDKQPLEYPSAGSTFKRPVGNYASALIEQSGLKGYVHKRAMVSAKHSGFVINHDHATSEEFLELIDIIKQVVKEKTGYELECEIRIIGRK